MTKRLSAVTGEYINKENQPKAEWTNIGVIITGKNGKDYVLLDPTVNLAGILLKQNIIAQKKGEAPSDMVMTSVFEEQQGQAPQQGGYQQQAPAQGYQAPAQQPQQPQYQQPQNHAHLYNQQAPQQPAQPQQPFNDDPAF